MTPGVCRPTGVAPQAARPPQGGGLDGFAVGIEKCLPLQPILKAAGQNFSCPYTKRLR